MSSISEALSSLPTCTVTYGKLCIIHIISENVRVLACRASSSVLNLTPCSIHKRKPIPKNEIFPDDANFAYTKNGWMTADFMEECGDRGTYGKYALQVHITHQEC